MAKDSKNARGSSSHMSLERKLDEQFKQFDFHAELLNREAKAALPGTSWLDELLFQATREFLLQMVRLCRFLVDHTFTVGEKTDVEGLLSISLLKSHQFQQEFYGL